MSNAQADFPYDLWAIPADVQAMIDAGTHRQVVDNDSPSFRLEPVDLPSAQDDAPDVPPPRVPAAPPKPAPCADALPSVKRQSVKARTTTATARRAPMTDPEPNGSRAWLRSWADAVRKDRRLNNASILTAMVLVEYAWTGRHTVAMSGRKMAEHTGRSQKTEAEHIRKLGELGWWYETSRNQNRKPVLQLQFPQGWEYFQGRDAPTRGWLSERDPDPN